MSEKDQTFQFFLDLINKSKQGKFKVHMGISATGIEVKERIPDNVLFQVDEVVNIVLTADELITRLKERNIYTPDNIEVSLKIFQIDQILQLRTL